MLVCPFCGREFPGGVEKCPDCLADLFFEATDGRRLDYASLVVVCEAEGRRAAQLAEALAERDFLVRVRPPTDAAAEEADRHAVLVAPEQAARARAVIGEFSARSRSRAARPRVSSNSAFARRSSTIPLASSRERGATRTQASS